jgi:XTP/dITP diphosphohydrolase
MKWVFATNNKNKLREVRAVMPDGWEILSLHDIGCFDELPETHETIEENSIEKAIYVREKYGYACFAEDSGLEVDALDGAPGVHSAHYSGSRDAHSNMIQVLQELKGESNRSARFKTVFTLVSDQMLEQFTGIIHGQITTKPLGEGGFGYDPIFRPDGYTKTFGEMDDAEKNAISHRTLAFNQLTDFIRKKFAIR